jgi:hypothetical protein
MEEKMSRVVVTNIEWDTSEWDDVDELDAPYQPDTSMTFRGHVSSLNKEELLEWIGDRLSEATGWCVNSFDYVVEDR